MLVHDDFGSLIQLTLALQAANLDVAAFIDSIAASAALETPRAVAVLITRIHFGSDAANGITLSLLARRKRPAIKVIFTASLSLRQRSKLPHRMA